MRDFIIAQRLEQRAGKKKKPKKHKDETPEEKRARKERKKEKKAKKKDRDAAEEHTRYVNLLSVIGPEMSQEK